MSHFYLVHPLIRKINEKKIEKKINIDLAVLPSHDKIAKLIFIFLFFSFSLELTTSIGKCHIIVT